MTAGSPACGLWSTRSASSNSRSTRTLRASVSTAGTSLSLRIKGPRIETLEKLGDQVVERLRGTPGLRNVRHSNQELTQELSVQLDRERTAGYGLDAEDIGKILGFTLLGKVVTDFIAEDRRIDVLLRLDREDIGGLEDLESILLFSKTLPRVPTRLGDIAQVTILPQPTTIMRDRQQRMVEVTASLDGKLTPEEAIGRALEATANLDLPPGYSLYEAGSLETLQESRNLSRLLLGLACSWCWWSWLCNTNLCAIPSSSCSAYPLPSSASFWGCNGPGCRCPCPYGWGSSC